jgi:hypothetical protein
MDKVDSIRKLYVGRQHMLYGICKKEFKERDDAMENENDT